LPLAATFRKLVYCGGFFQAKVSAMFTHPDHGPLKFTTAMYIAL
jgi:hypothetical protein